MRVEEVTVSVYQLRSNMYASVGLRSSMSWLADHLH